MVLDNIFFLDNVLDKWIWKHNPVEEYTVKGVYHILMPNDTLTIDLICIQA